MSKKRARYWVVSYIGGYLSHYDSGLPQYTTRRGMGLRFRSKKKAEQHLKRVGLAHHHVEAVR